MTPEPDMNSWIDLSVQVDRESGSVRVVRPGPEAPITDAEPFTAGERFDVPATDDACVVWVDKTPAPIKP